MIDKKLKQPTVKINTDIKVDVIDVFIKAYVKSGRKPLTIGISSRSLMDSSMGGEDVLEKHELGIMFMYIEKHWDELMSKASDFYNRQYDIVYKTKRES